MIETLVSFMIKNAICGAIIGSVAVGISQIWMKTQDKKNTEVNMVEGPIFCKMKFNFDKAIMAAYKLIDNIDIFNITPDPAESDSAKVIKNLVGRGGSGYANYANPYGTHVMPLSAYENIKDNKKEQSDEVKHIQFSIDVDSCLHILSTDDFVEGWNPTDTEFDYDKLYEYVSTPLYNVCFCTLKQYISMIKAMRLDEFDTVKKYLYFIIDHSKNDIDISIAKIGLEARRVFSISKNGYIDSCGIYAYKFAVIFKEFIWFFQQIQENTSENSFNTIEGYDFFDLIKSFLPYKKQMWIDKAIKRIYKNLNLS